MKKTAIFILALFLAAVLLCLLCGCSSGRVVQHDWDRLIQIEDYRDCVIYADTKTGVEYLRQRGGDGLAPVLNPDGSAVTAPNFDAEEGEH